MFINAMEVETALRVLFGDSDDSVYSSCEWAGDLLEFSGIKDGHYDQLDAQDLYWIDSLSIEVEEWVNWGAAIDAYISAL